MDVAEEAKRLSKLYAADPPALIGYLAMQLATVKTYAQVLIGLCGLVITVTGFSGAHMIRASSASAFCMVAGIALVLVGLVLCLRAVTALRWVSQELRDDLTETAEVCIRRRNEQQRWVGIAAIFVAGGLGCYLASVSIAAIVPDGNFRF
jgi:hypothetical protein